jgi:tRNA U34 2-thiouridine synthase MnmA/TrmU
MNRKAVALLSGGLDSTLAIKILQEQGIEIEAINFQTMFGCCKDDARKVAHELGVRLTMLPVGMDYVEMVKNPKYGTGKAINPCVDCRIYMFRLGKKFMETVGASFVVSGEVLGQRPMSQRFDCFETIERDAELQGLIVRPLSAKLLEPTIPEKEGVVSREKLYDIQGRSRAGLLELARKYGIENPPQPSTGCALTEPEFAKKVKDIFQFVGDYERWHFEILKTGRHFRLDPETKLIVGRDATENEYLAYLHPKGTTLFSPLNFAGPSALLVGQATPEMLQEAGRLIFSYTKHRPTETPQVQWEVDGKLGIIEISSALPEEALLALRIT